MKRILLDTNAYAALLAGDEAVFDTLAAADRVLMSPVVLGELHAAFNGGTRERANRELLEEF
ncbi:MAG TPA: twitching motility protein PilT, partial [Acidobacteria bacterium]|nr:twitching motility protein PilT [Acidobacteriota bacterium]